MKGFDKEKMIGMSFQTKSSGECFIIDYKSNKEVLVMFLDGIIKSTSMVCLKKGSLRSKTFEDKYLGKRYKTLFCGSCTVIEYTNSTKVKVRFDDGTVVQTSTGGLEVGKVKNPNTPKVFGVGINDAVEFTNTQAYVTWNSMIRRCYSAVYQKKQPNYIGCQVEPEWLRFSKFLDYFKQIPFSEYAETEGYQFDKDILSDGRRGYFKGCVCFVPPEINKAFIKESKTRGYSSIRKKFTPSLRQDKFQCIVKELGVTHLYETPEEALNAYKLVKGVYVQRLAEKYKGKIADEVYLKLKNYVVKTVD